MSQNDHEIINESSDEQKTTIDKNERLVSVSEAIRYRKRAQTAEQKLTELNEQLSQNESEISQLSEKLSTAVNDYQLVKALAVAGATDLEAAVLVTKARFENDADSDIAEIIADVKKQKSHLFSGTTFTTPQRTSPVKIKNQSVTGPLGRAAQKAVTSRSRADLQEYLRLRRNFV